MDTNEIGTCDEKHSGLTPRSVMTKGISTGKGRYVHIIWPIFHRLMCYMDLPVKGSPYGNLDLGNEDKLMITYHRDSWSHNYSMTEACSVLYEGEMHFFGGIDTGGIDGGDGYSRQHFTIETKRSGKMVRMMKQHNLEIGFDEPSCSTFEITSQYFTWLPKNVVVLCFDAYHQRSCYSFDGNSIGKISNKTIGDSNFHHYLGGLIKYKRSLLTVGGGYRHVGDKLMLVKSRCW